MRSTLLCTAIYALHALAAPSWTSTPFSPPSIPLAVRSPYVNTWLKQGAGTALNDAWPVFWAGQTAAWVGFVSVDGKPYSYMGTPSVDGSSYTKATQKSMNFTATQSTFVLSAGPVDLTVTFLSPTDYVKLSIPLSYMTVAVTSTDGNAHSVQVYSDVTGEWLSGSDGWDIEWSTTTTDITSHKVSLKYPALYEEIDDHIQYGSLYYSTLSGKGVTFQTGQDILARGHFLNNSVLPNTRDTNFRAIGDVWPVFALAKDLGSVKSGSVTFSVGHIRDPSAVYILPGNVRQERSLYFWSKFSTAEYVVSFFLNDYADALKTANALDARIAADAAKISPDYFGIVALSIRQSLAANELTISKNKLGLGWNTSDIMLFMKEISSDGNMNTVDVIFPASPIFHYLYPELGMALLEPLYRYQASGLYPNKWSIHDMGAHFPKAIGHAEGLDEAMPVVRTRLFLLTFANPKLAESGNMLIMAYSFAKQTGDFSQIKRYRTLLDQWTQFLIEDSLIPTNQLSTDDFAGTLTNQTNLAIKGIVGIRCMAEIAKLLGDTKTYNNYSSIAADYVTKWQVLANSTTGPHTTLNCYTATRTLGGQTYNLFFDVQLGLNLFPESLYEQQTAWYKTHLNEYGLPLDTRHTYTKSDWTIWTAGIVRDQDLRDQLVSAVAKYAGDGLNSDPFSDWYDTVSGQVSGFRARPVVGGHLALLLL
ncbi:hypothetical protein FB45DRAFT_1142317 [Roridomyces roridus]|uniref:DUF1793-domain-containing protein n=1 Tax=Roridomyces roridus TaxID=1738132 RepID=A0AAD7BZF1_9AGAR|nr:hypothetical protein FB45DRAFT_1142317 [Roridomyces roridus]